MSLGYVTNFNIVAKGSGFNVFDQKPDETPKKTILQSLYPDQSFKVDTGVKTASDLAKVDPKSAHAGAQISQNKSDLGVMQGAAVNMKGQISTAIRQAQQEVAKVTQGLGHKVRDIFPEANNTPESAGQLLGATGMMKATGANSAIMKAVGNLETAAQVEDLVSDPRALKNSEVLAQIELQLRAATSKREDSREDSSLIKDASVESPELKTSEVDWNEFFDQGHKLEDFMAIDPDNPPKTQVPEFSAARDIENNAVDAQLSLDEVEQERKEYISTVGNIEVVAKKFEQNEDLKIEADVDAGAVIAVVQKAEAVEAVEEPKLTAAEVTFGAGALREIFGVKTDKDAFEALSKDAKICQATLNNEYKIKTGADNNLNIGMGVPS